MFSKIVLYAEDKIANMICNFYRTTKSDFYISYIANSYKNSIEKAIELNAQVIILQLKHPVYKIHNFFYDLAMSNIYPMILIFNVISENQIIYSITSHKDITYINKIKSFFTQSLSKKYTCHFNYIGEEKDSNLIMDFRISKLEKTEYLKDILRGVIKSEFLYYKKKVNLNLNDYGYYVYICNLMEIEYSDHYLNKNIYYLTGEEFIKECETVLDEYSGGEVFYIDPDILCIIINDFNCRSIASKQNKLFEITNKLNNVTKSKTAFRYMSSYIKDIENIRDAYESFHCLKAYNFFCSDAKLLTQKYINSIKKEIDYTLVDNTLKQIKELINYDIFNIKLNKLIYKLFLDIVKPSLDYNLYYYCHTSLSSALADRYSNLYKKILPESSLSKKVFFTSIEDKCSEFIDSVNQLKSELSNKYMIKNSIVIQVLNFIHIHYMENITVNLIASSLNISNSYLSQIFKKEIGTSIIKYIINYRVEKAKELLSSSDELIYNIAEKVGFCDEKHFSKTFKKITGLTPMQYKKQNEKAKYI
ncbi:AraC family transcriptional regulator [Clostridium autoethanogenum]|uniref:AraC family transcriptional regulator n=1 Tax=Clostridium autoethanogenum TaxID=84023 RepID=A0A3M0SXP7_9CLOT|nr:AraC family transcriptional regulator [Clostridium autoethanogenum]RMD03150.1 AraC family transcriptional regulator [Clostridium autoethanogenum]